MKKTTHAALVALALADPSPIALGQDVPYEPTAHETVRAMLDAAKVGPNDFVIDLGSGDGRIVIAAARDFGARALGVDLNLDLLSLSKKNAIAAGVKHLVEFRRQDLFDTDLGQATVVTMFLWPEVNLRLRSKILTTMRPGSRVVSHEHDMGDWEPDALIVRGEDTIHLWIVPAQVEGVWSVTIGEDGKRQAELRLVQTYQTIEGELVEGGRSVQLEDARLIGDLISFEAADLRFQGTVIGSTIRGNLGGRPATMTRSK
jgi:SAM-dependent methyltransferase